MERKLEDLTIVEIKSIAYDTIIQLQMTQQNLQIINEELARRNTANQQSTPVQTFNPPNVVVPDSVTTPE